MFPATKFHPAHGRHVHVADDEVEHVGFSRSTSHGSFSQPISPSAASSTNSNRFVFAEHLADHDPHLAMTSTTRARMIEVTPVRISIKVRATRATIHRVGVSNHPLYGAHRDRSSFGSISPGIFVSLRRRSQWDSALRNTRFTWTLLTRAVYSFPCSKSTRMVCDRFPCSGKTLWISFLVVQDLRCGSNRSCMGTTCIRFRAV